MYRIVYDYGTHQTCWTWKTALEWLSCCSDNAMIVHRLTGVMLAMRHTVRG